MGFNKKRWESSKFNQMVELESQQRKMGDRAIMYTKMASVVIEIGDWDMDFRTWVEIEHGLGNIWKKVRTIDVLIRNDFDSEYHWLQKVNHFAPDEYIGGWVESITSHSIKLYRRNSPGYFDSTSFDSTNFNRGWITFWYEA